MMYMAYLISFTFTFLMVIYPVIFGIMLAGSIPIWLFFYIFMIDLFVTAKRKR